MIDEPIFMIDEPILLARDDRKLGDEQNFLVHEQILFIDQAWNLIAEQIDTWRGWRRRREPQGPFLT